MTRCSLLSGDLSYNFKNHGTTRWPMSCLIVLVLAGLCAPRGLADQGMQTIKQGSLTASFDGQTGRLNLSGEQGRLLWQATAAAVGPGNQLMSLAEGRYQRECEAGSCDEPLLAGPQLRAQGKDTQGKLDLEWRVTLLKDTPAAVFEIVVTNSSSEPLQLLRSEPLRLSLNEQAGCFFGATNNGSSVRKALTNGRMYYDPGKLFDFSTTGPGEIHSHFDIAFHCPDTRATMVAGFLENREAEGTFSAGWHPAGAEEMLGAFNLTARAEYNDFYVLKPGASTSSGRLLVMFADDPYAGLETYARLSGLLHNVKLNSIINGWCSWFVTYGDVTQDEVIKHAEFIARELKPYGMEWVQIDDGYQQAFGNWEGVPAKFPKGMKWVADRIKELGLRPGIWVAPYAISADTDIARNHPDWLAHDAQGIQAIEAVHQAQAQYILDITHPGARQWLSGLFHTLTQDWGYDFIKTDFVEWTILAAGKYHDPSVSKAGAYRMGIETMRQAMGPDRHMLDCGPALIGLGLIDSMRIELDRPSPPCTVWEHYSGWYNSVIPAVAKRYYFHRHAWINDPDHLRTAALTIPQAQAAATILGLAGGTVISGDRLYTLDTDRLDILKKILPSYGETARPVDLLEKPLAETFALRIEKPFGHWWLIGCFNGAADVVRRELDLAQAGLDAGKTWLVYEFWSQKLLGQSSGRFTLDLEPTSVKLLVIREKQDVPQVLGTDRHMTNGGIELADVKWDAQTHTLAGVALGAPAMKWRLAVHVPEGFALEEDPGSRSGLAEVTTSEGVLYAQPKFPAAGQTSWSLRFRKKTQR